MRVALILILTSTILWSCQDKTNVVNSQTYLDEELTVYNQLLDNLLDSISYRVRQRDTVKQVFFIQDTLNRIGNSFLNTELEKYKFSIAKATKNSRHRFLRTGDTLKLNANEIFTGDQLTISRVSLDDSFTNGLFVLETHCGDLCGAGYIVEIEKIDGRWTIKKWEMMWVS
jgi:hypothetical protein